MTAARYAMCRRAAENVTEYRVVDYLAALERIHGKATPTREGIAAAIGRCVRSVSRAVTALEARGVLRVWRDPPHRRTDGTYTRARTNLYRLLWPKRHVKPRGHPMHHNAASRSSSTGGPPTSPTPVAPVAPPLPLEDALPPPSAPAPPPWVRLGITRDEWIARQRH